MGTNAVVYIIIVQLIVLNVSTNVVNNFHHVKKRKYSINNRFKFP